MNFKVEVVQRPGPGQSAGARKGSRRGRDQEKGEPLPCRGSGRRGAAIGAWQNYRPLRSCKYCGLCDFCADTGRYRLGEAHRDLL